MVVKAIAARCAPALVLILPVWMMVLSLAFKKAEGAYWEAPKVDPSYSYLVGSLAYAVGQPSMCCLHPGVTVQVNGAWILRLTHAVFGHDELAADVLSDPEVYAAAIGFEETLLYGCALLLAGWMVFRATGSLESALLIQIAPFLDLSSFHWLSPIAPEAILYSLVVLAAALAVIYRPGFGTNRVAIFLGLLSGAGVATKITYLPAALLPLVLVESWSGRLIYILVTSACFAAIAVPHWATVDNALYFWSQLLHNRGLHGSGETGRPRASDLLASIGAYIQSDRIYMLLLLLSVAFAVWMFFSPKAKSGRTLAILIACEVLQLILASRQFNLRYLSPAYGLLSANLVLIALSIRDAYPRSARWLKAGCIVGIALLAVIRSRDIAIETGTLRAARASWLQLATAARRGAPDATVVDYYGASGIPFALHFGDTWVYRYFSPQLAGLYPRQIFWDAYRRNFEGFEGNVSRADLCRVPLLQLRGAPFGAQPMGFSPPDGLTLEELGSARGETFYRAGCRE